uniref:Uncharacterized protein n=1 Tax=Chromera velia CCMP2878 TaxID=1169474 RepID=A0A0G4HZD5_9ALVE|eukprot:Cvel_9710.t1-p1 / transcript=Cvel_9710.t1 / gene=Cvel_9710 / organism=Chromera_velia_CCMP2878 / gene_product=Beta-1,4-mannosyl-glycoprotein, putative / transcript_product=Beta-1,4-mannosyl-glycoprotein, putative / location=Cvel_scaffold566:67291-68619(-) / protein_length=443 / sequence_SO=supercontig / SO=protein_coding / is_pseudo=false
MRPHQAYSRFKGAFLVLGIVSLCTLILKAFSPSPSGSSALSASIRQGVSLLEYLQAIKGSGLSKEDVVWDLNKFNQIPPFGINSSCTPPPLRLFRTDADCTNPPEFNGTFVGLRATPAVVVDVTVFSFELDTLEIRLNELDDVVDLFFIAEQTVSHLGGSAKPLVFTANRNRFAKFAHKIVHIVVDDVESSIALSEVRGGDEWALEFQMRSPLLAQRVARYHFEKPGGVFRSADDVILRGDLDEVPSRDSLNAFKYCRPRLMPADFAISMPMGKLGSFFASDWPMPGYPYSFTAPSVSRVGDIFNISDPESVQKAAKLALRYRNGAYVMGGMHLTSYQHIPFSLLKDASIVEGRKQSITELIDPMLRNGREAAYVLQRAENEHMPAWKARLKEGHEIEKVYHERIHKVPWFLQCNLQAFPSWQGLIDKRIYLQIPCGLLSICR